VTGAPPEAQPKAVEVTVTEITETVLASQTALDIAKKVSQQVPRSHLTSAFESAGSRRRLRTSAGNMSPSGVSSPVDSTVLARETLALEPSASTPRRSALEGLSDILRVRRRYSGIVSEAVVSEAVFGQPSSTSHVASSAFGAFAPLALLHHAFQFPYISISCLLLFIAPPLC
jgi:hypothetical protein